MLNKYKTSFSLIELTAIIAIIAILSTIALPSYLAHVNKVRIAEIFTVMSYYKIHVADALAHTEPINKSYQSPTDLITKLTLKTIETPAMYIIQAEINTEKLNTKHPAGKPLRINLIGILQEEFLTWSCQIQAGYTIYTPENCLKIEVSPIVL